MAGRAKADIDHRPAKPFHPSTNGQVEQMNRTLKDATVGSYHYVSHEQIRVHLAEVATAHMATSSVFAGTRPKG